jgi:hypothetical protein
MFAWATAARPLPAFADAPRAGVLPIVAARTSPLGTLVTVEGAVTVPPGAFRSGTLDEGFAIQDRTGGIYVSVPVRSGLQVGQRARVNGRLADSFGMVILEQASFTRLQVPGWGRRTEPARVATGQIGEATEGRLVEVEGRITQPVGNDLPYGYRLFVDDGSGEVQVFVYASTGIDPGGLQPGQRVRAVGLGGQFNDHYELLPRSPRDLRRLR